MNSIAKQQSFYNRCLAPSQLKITDVRFTDVVVAPMHCTLMKIYTNQGITGLGEVRGGGNRVYAEMLKSRILGENPCNVEKLFRRIGQAVCKHGDVVLGTISGVIFIPAQHAEHVVENAEKSHVRDIFGFDRLQSKTYTTAQIDTQWTVSMYEDFIHWFETDPRAEEYRHLRWDRELEEARRKEAEAAK